MVKRSKNHQSTHHTCLVLPVGSVEHLTWGTRVWGEMKVPLKLYWQSGAMFGQLSRDSHCLTCLASSTKNPAGELFSGCSGKFILIIKWKDKYDSAVYRNETKLKSFHSKSFYYFAHMMFLRSTVCHAWVLTTLNLWGKNIWCTIHFIHKNKTYHNINYKTLSLNYHTYFSLTRVPYQTQLLRKVYTFFVYCLIKNLVLIP